MPILTNPNIRKLPTGSGGEGNAAAFVAIDVMPGEVCDVEMSGFSRIESLYVDNTRGAAQLFIRFNDTMRQITVPPGAEGCYFTYSADNGFTVQQPSQDFPVRARIRAFSCHQTIFERFPGAGLPECPWDVNNLQGGRVPGILYTQIIPTGLGKGGWDRTLLVPNSAATISDSGNNTGGDVYSVLASALPIRMRQIKARSSGKWYFELSWNGTGGDAGVGLFNTSQFNGVLGNASASNDLFVNMGGYICLGPAAYSAYPNNPLVVPPNGGSPIGFAIDLDAGKAYIRSAEGFVAGSDPVSGVNSIIISGMIKPLLPGISSFGAPGNITIAAGNTHPFWYPLPAGYAPWNG